MRRILPASLLVYWGAFLAYRAVGVVAQWQRGGEVRAAEVVACIAAFGELLVGFCAFMAASLVLVADGGLQCLDCRFFRAVGLAAVAFVTLDWGLSSRFALPSEISPATPAALILSVIALAGMMGSWAAPEGPPRAANDNSRMPGAIGVFVRLANLRPGRGAGS